ncbi:MAG: selenocysteine-specific translation elongation factor [Bordetella sp.]|nr:MAG: selenocysteine-specific translation elongation factor [Bordetella sp.]
MIVGTAGHIDHGKSALVRALTGVNTDRLIEEKRRGLSIELGYAYMPYSIDNTISFIDVPGHEKFIKTMLAGIGGIDFALLVVAADDGIMPQTHEHFNILKLLGISKGSIVITKTDKVNTTKINKIHEEIKALTFKSFLKNSYIFNVNSLKENDKGIFSLRKFLIENAKNPSEKNMNKFFRLAVDRSFTLIGKGTIVTGTVYSGQINIKNNKNIDLNLMPNGKKLRVRSIHSENKKSDIVHVGQRCALNLIDIEKTEVSRGNWIADPQCFLPSANIDVEFHLLSSAKLFLHDRTLLHIHLGAGHHMARVIPLINNSVKPGEITKVQLVFDSPVCSMPGDYFIARNAQANSTIGGGRVLDSNASIRKRRSYERLEWLNSIKIFLDGMGLESLMKNSVFGIKKIFLERLLGYSYCNDCFQSENILCIDTFLENQKVFILSSHWNSLCNQALEALTEFHNKYPDEPGLNSAQFRQIIRLDGLWKILLKTLLADGYVSQNGPWIYKSTHNSSLNNEELNLAKECLSLIINNKNPSWVRYIATKLCKNEDYIRKFFKKLMRQGDIIQILPDLFYHKTQIISLAKLMFSLCLKYGNVTPAIFRDSIHIGRKHTIQILEFFNKIGYTRRLNNVHLIKDQTIFQIYDENKKQNFQK